MPLLSAFPWAFLTLKMQGNVFSALMHTLPGNTGDLEYHSAALKQWRWKTDRQVCFPFISLSYPISPPITKVVVYYVG